MNVHDHYENHLGNFYSWMIGDFDTRQKEQEDYFYKNCIFPRRNRIAFDLGAGNGIQSVALAKLGFDVKAFDFSSQLLHELRKNSAEMNVEIIAGDFTNPELYGKYSPELIVCMGDTITHLESIEKLNELIRQIYNLAAKDALFIVSFRDLSKELKDEQRFIPVKADQNKILTCFLEYFPEYVNITDILHEKVDNSWTIKVSSYKKLRLGIENLRNLFSKNGFSLVNMALVRGLNHLIFQKQ